MFSVLKRSEQLCQWAEINYACLHSKKLGYVTIIFLLNCGVLNNNHKVTLDIVRKGPVGVSQCACSY